MLKTSESTESTTRKHSKLAAMVDAAERGEQPNAGATQCTELSWQSLAENRLLLQ